MLSQYYTDNLAKANAKGVEASAKYRPATWISVSGNYMWLETEVLSLNGGIGLVQQYFYLGPAVAAPAETIRLCAGELPSRQGGCEPHWAISAGAISTWNRTTARPAGLYWNGGYVNAGINVNYRVRSNLTLYANLRNALDRHYEEIYGYPAPLLNVVAGVKWSLARAR